MAVRRSARCRPRQAAAAARRAAGARRRSARRAGRPGSMLWAGVGDHASFFILLAFFAPVVSPYDVRPVPARTDTGSRSSRRRPATI